MTTSTSQTRSLRFGHAKDEANDTTNNTHKHIVTVTFEADLHRQIRSSMSEYRYSTSIYQFSLNALPGIITWVVLVLSLLGSLFYPRQTIAIAAVLASYLTLRFMAAAIANIIGLRRIRVWEQIDWRSQYADEASDSSLALDTVHHVIIIPNYNEPLHVLQQTLDALTCQHDARQRITIVLAMEAAEANSAQKAHQLTADYQHAFADILCTIHPSDLVGEVRGKSANLAWAFVQVQQWLTTKPEYNTNCVVVTAMDCDTLWHENYFLALAYLFATHPDRHYRMWQAPIRYHGNIWKLVPVLRPLHAYATAFELGYSSAPWWNPMPMSSYSISFTLLEEINGWDTDVIADEWHLFIKAYFKTSGHIQVEPVMLPFVAQVVTGTTWQATFKNRYHQSVRHAWGSKEIGYTIDRMLHHHEIRLRDRWRLLVRVTHDLILSGAGWGILTLGSQLPLLLHKDVRNEIFDQRFSHPAFLALQVAFGSLTVLGMIFWYIDVRARPMQANKSMQDRVLEIVSLVLLPVMTFLFATLPVIHAQTQMIVKRTTEFKVTSKK